MPTQVIIGVLSISMISPLTTDAADGPSSLPLFARSSSHSYSSSQSWSPGKDGKMHTNMRSTREDSVNDGGKEHHAIVSMDCIDGHCNKMSRHSTGSPKSSGIDGNSSIPSDPSIPVSDVFKFPAIQVPSFFASPLPMMPMMSMPRSFFNDSFANSSFGQSSSFPNMFNDSDLSDFDSDLSPQAARAKSKPEDPAPKHRVDNTATQSDSNLRGKQSVGRLLKDVFGVPDASLSHEDMPRNAPVIAHGKSDDSSQSYTSTISYTSKNGKKEIIQKKERCKDGKCQTFLRQTQL